MNNHTLKEKLAEAEQERDYFASLVEAFFEGRVPQMGASLRHHILAQWGRQRLEQLRGKPALLRSSEV